MDESVTLLIADSTGGQPRFCTTEQLASLFGFSPHWIYKLNKRGKGPPRLKGVRPYRYDIRSKEFFKWLQDMGVDVGQDRTVDTQETYNI